MLTRLPKLSATVDWNFHALMELGPEEGAALIADEAWASAAQREKAVAENSIYMVRLILPDLKVIIRAAADESELVEAVRRDAKALGWGGE